MLLSRSLSSSSVAALPVRLVHHRPSSSVAALPVLLVGHPVLHRPSAPVADPTSPSVVRARAELHATLEAFRRAHGFGRAISAPQIGHSLRFIALNLGRGRVFTMHNPVLTPIEGAGTLTMWDDCMSFPDYLVRVRRHRRVRCAYVDEAGREVVEEELGEAVSELLQHEVDHLDGVTAFDRIVAAGDGGGGAPVVVHRREYEARRSFFDGLVDYAIAPTVGLQ
jgi:peptide deformylase